MNNDSAEVTVKGVMPTSNGCAIFLGNEDKTFVIHADPSIGNAINMTMNQVKKERPLTHDLIGLILKGLETSIERVLINDVDEGTFFARIILRMENELGKKIIELDARPSDSIVLALQMKQPIPCGEQGLGQCGGHVRDSRADSSQARLILASCFFSVISKAGLSSKVNLPETMVAGDWPTALAPMQDVTSLPFMQVVARRGSPDFFFTEFIRVHAHSRIGPEILSSILDKPDERPVLLS